MKELTKKQIFDLQMKWCNFDISEDIKNEENYWNTEEYWDEVSQCELTEEFIEEFNENINWSELLFSQSLSEDLLIKYVDRFDDYNWFQIFIYQDISASFVLKFKDKVEIAGRIDYEEGGLDLYGKLYKILLNELERKENDKI